MTSFLSHKPNVARDAATFNSSYVVSILSGSFVFSAAINLLMLSVPLYSLQVFSRAIPSGNTDTLIMLTLIVVIALSMIALLEVVRTNLLNRCGNGLELAWRRRLGAEVLDSAGRGRPDASPLADLAEVKGALGRPTLTALMDLPWTPFYVVGIYVIHPLLAGVMVLSMLLLTALGVLAHVLSRGPSEEMRLPAGRAERLLSAVQARADTVRGLRMGPAALDAVLRDTETTAALSARVQERGAAIGAFTRWVRYLLQIAVTGIGAWLVIEHHLSFGGMIATSMLVGRGMSALEQTVGNWGALVRSRQAWQRLSAVMTRLSREPERAAVAVGPERLTVENVLFVNPRDQKPVLRAVSFHADPGEVVCIVGQNRTGKTVLARLLAGVQAPSAGTVRLGGLAVANLVPKDPLTAIGYLPQTTDLLPGTIGQNIARFLPVQDEAVAQAARRAGMHGWVETLAQGYETEAVDAIAPIGTAASRMVALARAGFGHPPMIVLDEPGMGLDELGVKAVRAFIADARERGATVIVLSTGPQFVDLADKTFVIQNGMLAAATPRPDVTANFGRVRTVSATPAAATAG